MDTTGKSHKVKQRDRKGQLRNLIYVLRKVAGFGDVISNNRSFGEPGIELEPAQETAGRWKSEKEAEALLEL